ncbi:MAG: sulfatase-like hydrolase/transferase [Opitutaceae bacterium]|nr:sulfatase-like hydrolase/transferase [Opitutaceae bacterium]
MTDRPCARSLAEGLRRAFIFCVLAVSVASAATPAAAPTGLPRPNILLVTADNLGFGDVGCFGNREILTPNIDALAQDGVRCTAYYSASPTCTVSRATLLTGRYPQRIKLNHQLPGIAGNYGIGLRHSERLIPAYLKPAGYATGAFGKWNIGFAPGSRPTERGFDEFIGNVSGNIDYQTYSYQGKHDLHRGTAEYRTNTYSTDLYADSTIDFIRRHAGGPFFAYLPFNAPHYPSAGNLPKGEPVKWQAPEEYFKLYGFSPDEPDPKKRYRVVVSAMDAALGRVLRKLDELGLRQNTLVIFYSDNGAFMHPGHGLEVASNAPFRDGGVTLWEGGIRVPAVFRWPGRLPAGTVCAEPIISTDILPLLLHATGLPLPADRALDGIDPTETLAGRARSPHDLLFWEFTQSRKTMSAVRDRQYKLIRQHTTEPFELYDLLNDPGETKNLASAKPAVTQALEQAYTRWIEAVNE